MNDPIDDFVKGLYLQANPPWWLRFLYFVARIFFTRDVHDALTDRKASRSLAAAIESMTPYERHHPEVIDKSREKRIAVGAGIERIDVRGAIACIKAMWKRANEAEGT